MTPQRQTAAYELEEMDRIFRAWGALPRMNNPYMLDYPSVNSVRRMYSLPGQTVGGRPSAADDDLFKADRAINEALSETPELRKAFTLYYCTGYSQGHIGRCAVEMRMRYTSYAMLLSSARDNVITAFHDIAF